MDGADKSFAPLEELLEARFKIVSRLAESLQASTAAMGRNEAEMIARGAAHQAELCRQWSTLEDKLRRASGVAVPASPVSARESVKRIHRQDLRTDDLQTEHRQTGHRQTKDLHEEWRTLEGRIRDLVRVHAALLRHAERSLAIAARIFDGCNPTYAPPLTKTGTEFPHGEWIGE